MRFARILLLLVAGLGLSRFPTAAQPDSLDRQFEAGNEAYRQGRYERAVEVYQGLLENGYASAALYHNLGNAHVRIGRVGPAIRYYEKARRLRPDDPSVRHNLTYVRQQEGLPIGGFPRRGLEAVVSRWSPLTLFLGGWLVLTAGLIGAVFGDRPAWLRRRRRTVVWGAVGIGMLLVSVAFATSYMQAEVQHAVVIVERAGLRPTPDAATPRDTTVGEGTMLRIESRRTGWTQVRLANRSTGWMPAEALGDV